MHTRWRPAVPLETAAAYGAPTASANASSKRSIVGPSESRPERSTSATSSSSRSSSQGEERPIVRTDAIRSLRDGGRQLDDVEVVAPALVDAVDRCQVRLLELTRDRPDADLVVVDCAQRCDLGGGADHEDLVRQVEIRPDHERLLDLVAEVLRDPDDRVAGDSREDRHRERRRV